MEILLERIEKARTDNRIMGDLISDYLPYIYKEISRNGSYGIEFDERFSLGLVVFSRCVYQFEGTKGDFFRYTAVAIQNRLKDEGQRLVLQRQRDVLLDPEKQSSIDVKLAQNRYFLEQERLKLAEEIQLLAQEMELFSITFEQLELSAPKHVRLRKLCAETAETLAKNTALMETLRRTKRLPVSKLSAASGMTIKALDKYRRYIITSALILAGDYARIRSVIPCCKTMKQR